MTASVATTNSATRRVHSWLWRVRRGLLLLFLALAVLSVGKGDYRPSELEVAMAPYRYSIVAWELNHLSHKWTRALGDLWPGRDALTERERTELVEEFFGLGLAQRRMEGQLRRAELGIRSQTGPGAGTGAGFLPLPGAGYLNEAIEKNQARRQELLPEVEHIIEETLTQALREQGMAMRWLGIFPPVDAVFGSPPTVMVLSPRDRIYRQDDFLLQPGLNDEVKDKLEAVALDSANLSATVERTGGLSVYPSVVLDTAGLRFGLEAAAHEWVHQWLFFRPLGRNYRKSPEMLTLNETAATIAGEEIGDMAYTALTGEEVTRPWVRGNPERFDFGAEMLETRLRAEGLLAQGDIEGAEAYMEERRHRFVAQGYNIRNINQAYFAFYGSYATGPGSASAIGAQLQEVRRRTGSVGEFLDTMGQFGSYQEFEEYWDSYITN